MPDNRVFLSAELDANAQGWTVDLSQGDTANPDCYWRFRTKRSAIRFLRLVDNGMAPEQAYRSATA